MTMVEVANRQRRHAVDLEQARALAEHVLRAERREGAGLSVTVVSDRAIAKLHRDYLGVPGPTDVISFPLEDDLPGGPPLLGEVVVSADTAAREARARRLPFRRELLLYIAHGALHLLGYDDHAPRDRRRMHARQEALLDAFLAGRPGRRRV
jgi:probable rRNA maturation factor